MPKRSRYSPQEDLLLAESMFEVRRQHGKSPSETFAFRFPEVYDLFIRKCASSGLAGIPRPNKSIETRMYHVREAFKKRRLRNFFRGDDTVCLKSYKLWTKILQGEGSAAVKHQTSRDAGASCSHSQARAYDEGEGLPNHIDEPIRRNNRQQSNQQCQENAKRLLDAFTNACNERSQIEKTREETRRRQAQLEQDQRKWQKETLSTLIQKSNSDDGDNFSTFLESLEAMAKEDAELNRLREESAAVRIENDRENWEWERDTYEDLLAMYCDKRDRC